jgi:PAS domain S-box-containing protein
MDSHTLKLFFHTTLDDVFNLSDNPVNCADYFTHQISKLVDAKSVIVAIQNEDNLSQIFSIYPSSQKDWINQLSVREFIDSSIINNESQYWSKNNENEEIASSINHLKIENVISIPLISTGNNIGSVFLFDIARKNNIDEMMKLILKLAGVLALIIRNSLLSGNLEKAVESKTTELQKRNKELEDSESKYRKLVENSPDAIAIYTAQELVFVNKECLTLMRANSESELLGKNVIEFVHPDSREFVAARMKEALLNHQVLPLAEEKYIRLDGSVCDVDVKAIPITFEGQTAVQIIVRDITEQKLSEVTLKHERELYLDLVNAQPAGIYRIRVFSTEKWLEDAWSNSVNSPYIVELASDRFCEILGVSRTEFEKNPKIISDLIHPDDQVEFEIRNKEANIKQIPFSWDCRLIIKGEVKWVHFESLPRKLENGDIIFTGIVYDIGERKKAENALAESEEKFRSIFENSSVGKSMTSFDGVLKANKAYCEMLGYSLEELNSINWKTLTHKHDIETDLEKVNLLLSGKKEFDSWEKRYIHKDGHVVWVNITSTLQRDSNGKPLFFIAEFKDITNRKQTEIALRESKDRLDRAEFASKSGNWEILLDSGRVKSSKGAVKIYGLDREEFTLENIQKIPLPDYRQILNDSLKNLIENDVPYDVEFKIKTADTGEIKDIHSTAYFDKEKKLVFGIIRDITKEKQAQANLLETQAILQAAMDNSQAGIAIADAPDGRLRYVNDAGLFIRGESRDKIVENIDINQYVVSWQLLDMDERPLEPHEVPLARAIMFGEKNNREFIIRRNQGDDRVVLAKAAPIKNEREEVIAAVVVFHDITERKMAEDALKKSFSLLHASIESTADGILVVDKEGKTTLYNQKFAQMWGIPIELLEVGIDEQLLRYVITKLVDPDKFLDKVTELYKNPELASVDDIKLTDGRTFVRHSIPQRIGDLVVGRVWSFRDITDRLIAENALLEKMNDMTRLHNLTIGRELTMIELKKEVNELLIMAGKEEKYKIVK